jgi:predicted dehydrogenase
MLKLDNGGGVLGDVSYLAPDGVAYAMPQYWRITCHGTGGVIEAKLGAQTIQLTQQTDRQVQAIPVDANIEHGRLLAFLREVRGEHSEEALTTADVLRASRCALMIQESADQNRTNVCLT